MHKYELIRLIMRILIARDDGDDDWGMTFTFTLRALINIELFVNDPTPLDRFITEDEKTYQLRKNYNCGGKMSKMCLCALQLCGVGEATHHNGRQFCIIESTF